MFIVKSCVNSIRLNWLFEFLLRNPRLRHLLKEILNLTRPSMTVYEHILRAFSKRNSKVTPIQFCPECHPNKSKNNSLGSSTTTPGYNTPLTSLSQLDSPFYHGGNHLCQTRIPLCSLYVIILFDPFHYILLISSSLPVIRKEVVLYQTNLDARWTYRLWLYKDQHTFTFSPRSSHPRRHDSDSPMGTV